MAYPPADRHRPRPDEPTGVTTRPTRRPSPRPTRSPPTATHNPPGSPTPASPHAHAPHEGASKIGPSLHPPLRTESPSDPGWFIPAPFQRGAATPSARATPTDPGRRPATTRDQPRRLPRSP